jgi:hypothetical protein
MGGMLLIPEARKDKAEKRIPAVTRIFRGDWKTFILILLLTCEVS